MARPTANPDIKKISFSIQDSIYSEFQKKCSEMGIPEESMLLNLIKFVNDDKIKVETKITFNNN